MVELAKRAIGNFFEDRMATYAEQLSYRGLFRLFPFIILVFALLAVLQLDAVFDRLIEASMGAPPQQIPEPLEPVAKEGRAQTEFLRPLIEQAREQTGGGLLSFGIVLSVWSVSAVAFTLTEALNVAYGVEETRSRRKRFAFALVFGPFLALAFIVACGLMLIGPQVAGWLAELAGLDEAWVALWAWLRFPVALLLLAVMLSVVYRFVPDTDRSFWSASPTISARFCGRNCVRSNRTVAITSPGGTVSTHVRGYWKAANLSSILLTPIFTPTHPNIIRLRPTPLD